MIKKQLSIFIIAIFLLVVSMSSVAAAAPVFDSTVPVDVTLNLEDADVLDLTFLASDNDNDTIIFSMTGLETTTAQLVEISAGVADLDWTPIAAEFGVYTVTITIDDSIEPVVTQTFTVTVNVAPTFNAVAPEVPTLNVVGGSPLNLLFEASDNNGDTLTFSMSGLPSTASFDTSVADEATLDWTPIASEEGEYEVTVTLSDGIAADVEQTFTVTVDDNVNDVPVLAAIGNQEVMETVELDLDFSTTDGDVSPVLSYNIESDLPVEALFVDNGDGSASLTWTPAEGDDDEYTVTITVEDDTLESDFETFTITVTGFLEDEEITMNELEDTLRDLENDFDDFDRDFCREYRRDDTSDMNDIENDVEDLLDQDLDDLQDDIDTLDDDIDDANYDDDLEDDLIRDLDNLQDDLDDLVIDVENWLDDSDDQRCTSSSTLSGPSASSFVPSTTTSSTPTASTTGSDDTEPSVTVTTITPPQTTGVTLATEETRFTSWDNMRTLVWLVAGTVVGLALLVFLLAMLFTSGRRRR
jgi:hypothetical protein